MSRGRHSNHAYIYARFSGEADHEHTSPVAGDNVHVLRRGTKYFAAHYFRMILANDELPQCIHAEAEHTGRELLPERLGNAPPPNTPGTPPTSASPTPPSAAAAATKATDSNCRKSVDAACQLFLGHSARRGPTAQSPRESVSRSGVATAPWAGR